MSETSERLLRQSYSEIIHGFSLTTLKDSTIYLRHFSSLDNLEIDFLYKESYEKLVAKGYPTEAERMTQLEKDHLWTKGDENNIKNLKDYIENLTTAKKKAFLRQHIDSINQQVLDQEKTIFEMVSKRDFLIGQTAERATRKKVDSRLIFKSLFHDAKFEQPVYSEQEFEELDNEELSDLFVIYNNTMDNFAQINIKKIALSPFFQNAFYLTESVYEFYGKPVCFLTNYQIQLSAFGNYYKQILSGPVKPPDEMLSDPDKLEDWHSGKTNADQVLEKAARGDNDNISLMGATREDLKNYGYDQEGIDIAKATREAGGTLDMEAILKLQGL